MYLINLKKIALSLLAFLALMLGFVADASAALNAGVQTAFTALQTDALALIDIVWPVATAVTVAFIILGLFKKAAAKAV